MIQSPKRSTDSTQGNGRWYEYYAGYSESFTISALKSATLHPNALVLDPWNGAGTTTNSCTKLGIKSMGFDLNPVMVLIAKANRADAEQANAALNDCKSVSKRYKVTLSETDALSIWLTHDAIENIRKIEKFILKGKAYNSLTEKAESLSTIQCIQYVALFNTLRFYLDKFIPSNPTWIKKAENNLEKVNFDWKSLKSTYLSQVSKISETFQANKGNNNLPTSELAVGSSTDLPINSQSVDLVLSSPPYCTRIDYAIATLPELAVLSVIGEPEIDSLRRALMGATTVPKSVPESLEFGGICDEFLHRVREHSSRASSTYYYKNFFQYFFKLSQSIKEIARVLKSGGKCYLVVQDSYYKDIHCDLAKIIVDMFAPLGVEHISTYEFQSKNNMANINPKGKKYRSKTEAIESVVELKKV